MFCCRVRWVIPFLLVTIKNVNVFKLQVSKIQYVLNLVPTYSYGYLWSQRLGSALTGPEFEYYEKESGGRRYDNLPAGRSYRLSERL